MTYVVFGDAVGIGECDARDIVELRRRAGVLGEACAMAEWMGLSAVSEEMSSSIRIRFFPEESVIAIFD